MTLPKLIVRGAGAALLVGATTACVGGGTPPGHSDLQVSVTVTDMTCDIGEVRTTCSGLANILVYNAGDGPTLTAVGLSSPGNTITEHDCGGEPLPAGATCRGSLTVNEQTHLNGHGGVYGQVTASSALDHDTALFERQVPPAP